MNKIIISHKTLLLKKQHVLKGLSGNDFRVATLPKSYLTVVEIIIKIDRIILVYLN